MKKTAMIIGFSLLTLVGCSSEKEKTNKNQDKVKIEQSISNKAVEENNKKNQTNFNNGEQSNAFETLFNNEVDSGDKTEQYAIIQTYLMEITNGHFDKAYNFLHSSHQSNINLDTFKVWKQLETQMAITKGNTIKYVEGNKFTVVLTYDNSRQLIDLEYDLLVVKENNEWKLAFDKPYLENIFSDIGTYATTKGDYYMSQGGLSGTNNAIEYYEIATKYDAENLNAFRSLGEIYRQKEDYDTAIKYYLQQVDAIKNNPLFNEEDKKLMYYPVYQGLTELYLSVNDKDNAQLYIDKMFEIDPDSEEAKLLSTGISYARD